MAESTSENVEDFLSDAAHFLEALESFADHFCSKVASRAYRERFSANYQALFPPTGRHYRAELLTACFERCPTIFVNGEKFEVDASILRLGDELLFVLQQLHLDVDRCGVLSTQLLHERELAESLEAFDCAWAEFEEAYIRYFMRVEDAARGLLVTACDCERRLRLYESEHPASRCDDGAYLGLIGELLRSLGKLNSVANVEGKGRDAFQLEVLAQALRELEAPRSRAREARASASSAAEDLCSEVLNAFAAVRQYLRAVAWCLESVDPHLAHNEGLVACLADWERSHDLGALFLGEPGVLRSLCEWVASAQEAKEVSPEMTALCDSYDAELFLVLPRLLWLSHLTAGGDDLLRRLLPHRFLVGAGPLRREFEALGAAPREELWRHAVAGPGSAPKGTALDRFLLELERFSMEVQRADPQEWNRCSHVAVQCLSGRLGSARTYHRFRV